MPRLGLLALAALFFAPPFPMPKKKPKQHVIQPKPLPQPKKPSCGTYEVAIPDLSNVDLHPAGNRGSTDVGGKHTLVVKAEAHHTDKRVRIDVDFSVKAHSGKKFVFERYRAHEMFFVDAKVPSGCRIASSESNDDGDLAHTRDSHNFRTAHGSGLLDEATCRTDTNGDDVGKLSCSRVTFKSVRVRTTAAASECQALRIPTEVTLPVFTHKGGDKEMGGNPVDLSIDGRYRRSGERILLDTTVRMREAEPDHTTFEGKRTDVLVDVARDYPDCKIRSVPSQRPRLRATTKPTHAAIFFNAYNGRPVLEDGLTSAYCRTDSNGNEHKQLSCSSVRYRQPGIGLEPK